MAGDELRAVDQVRGPDRPRPEAQVRDGRAEQRETPALARAARALGSKVAFVGIDTADLRHQAVAFVDRYKVPYPVAFDPNAKAADRYGVTGLPITVFLSPSAKTIVGENVGVLTSAKLDEILRRLYGVT